MRQLPKGYRPIDDRPELIQSASRRDGGWHASVGAGAIGSASADAEAQIANALPLPLSLSLSLSLSLQQRLQRPSLPGFGRRCQGWRHWLGGQRLSAQADV